MDELLKLIDNRVKANHMRSAVKSLPCTVTEVASENAVTVEVRSTGAKYTVPNYSGSAVSVGESVLLYYTGDILTGLNAYIGASINKETASNVGFVTGNVYTGALFNSNRTIAQVSFKAISQSVAQIVFNYVFYGTGSQTNYVDIYINGTKQSFSPIISLSSGQYVSAALSLPVELLSGSYTIAIQGRGGSTFYAGQINVIGHGITVSSDYQPTSDSDFIYEVDGDNSNIIYYIGDAVNPKIPTALNEKAVKIIRAVGFANSNVESVYIPDGVTTIE